MRKWAVVASALVGLWGCKKSGKKPLNASEPPAPTPSTSTHAKKKR
ncbi:MAG: hypothetical protein U0270_02310 [Labilithrix sp.]